MAAVQSFLSGTFPLELLVVGLIAAVAAIDALKNGTRRATVLVIAASLALVLYDAVFRAAYVANKLTAQSQTIKAVVFLALLVVLLILVYRLVPASIGTGSLPIQGLAGGIVVGIVLLVVWMQIPALVALKQPLPVLQSIFGNAYYFFWLLGAYALLAFVRR